VLAEELEGGVGQGHGALLTALARDPEQPAPPVDVLDPEVGALEAAEPARVDGEEADAEAGVAHLGEDLPDLVAAEDDGELPGPPGSGDVEDPPRAPEGLLVEELDAAQGEGVGAVGDLLDRGEVEEVAADVLLRELGGRAVVEGGELGDGPDVGPDGVVGVAGKRKVLDHATAQRGHGSLLERVDSWKREDPWPRCVDQPRIRTGGLSAVRRIESNKRVPPALTTFAPENTARRARRVGTLER